MGLHPMIRKKRWQAMPILGSACCWLLLGSGSDFEPDSAPSRAPLEMRQIDLSEKGDTPEWANDRPLTLDSSRLPKTGLEEGYEQAEQRVPLRGNHPVWRF